MAGKSWWKQDRAAFADQVANAMRTKLSFAAGQTAEIQKSSKLRALMAFRDRYIAHNLDIPQPDLNYETSVEHLKYGDETFLLEQTVCVADALHHGLNQTSFDWKAQ